MNIHQVFKSYSKKVWRKIASLPIKLNENNMGVSHTQRRRRNIKLEANIIRIECVELCGVCKTLYVHFFLWHSNVCVCARTESAIHSFRLWMQKCCKSISAHCNTQNRRANFKPQLPNGYY